MKVREGLIPTALGTVVTTAGLVSKKYAPEKLAWTVVGFGLAHVVLGSIDLVEHADESKLISNETETYQH